jgi:hypothetical protein
MSDGELTRLEVLRRRPRPCNRGARSSPADILIRRTASTQPEFSLNGSQCQRGPPEFQKTAGRGGQTPCPALPSSSFLNGQPSAAVLCRGSHFLSLHYGVEAEAGNATSAAMAAT